VPKRRYYMKNITAWERVLKARAADRPTASFYINSIFDSFTELHGDRAYGDDKAIIGGIARLCGKPVTVIAQEKGVGLADKKMRNFGSPHPEGYRKAMRLMKQAEKFRRPIICIVDTQGAHCGADAERRGQGEAIAKSLAEMMSLTVPVVSVIIGEGGSGGALAMAVANEVLILENAVYSILSPEGFASILYKDGTKAPEAAEVMKMTSKDLQNLVIVDIIVEECEADNNITAKNMKEAILTALEKFDGTEGEELSQMRYERFRKF
jgi:acetyl-CoA carboxylase carboxyl transferase alpha subunit